MSNQRLVDMLLRSKVYALGYAKHVTDRVLKILDDTEPEIRKELLDIFGTNPGTRVVLRLREAEKRLARIRGAGWSRSTNEAISMLLDLFLGEPETLSQAASTTLALPTVAQIKAAFQRTLVVGHTLKDWFASLRAADIRKMIGQLRVSVFGGESVTQLLRRLMGKLSPIAVALKNQMSSLIATTVGSVSNKVRDLTAGLNGDVFDMELWVSVLDNKTTRTCRRLDGQTFPRGVGIQPGYHFHCRSDRVPLMTGGGIPAIGNYSAWVGTQSAEFQRYAGKDEFKYRDLRPLTLNQVKRGLSKN